MQEEGAIEETFGQQDKERRPAPPYVSYLTFKTLINWLENEGVPLRFDRSFWSKKFSGSVGSQLMVGLRFLGLLVAESPAPSLEKLVQTKGEDRKAELREVFQQAYSLVKFQELPRATPGMLREWFSGYAIEGDTLRKAESFFINAMKDADTPISNALRKMARIRPPKKAGGISKGRRDTKEDIRGQGKPIAVKQFIAEPHSIDTESPEGGQQQVVMLESGGVVTLTLVVNLFQLSERDREFVLGLVDHVRQYARGDPKEKS